MAAPLPLEGDGLVENLFHYLWMTDDLGGGPRVSVPPTVIYRGSQPVAWYFTSRKSGRIKRKHRANLTAAHIEHSFTKKKASTDIVAFYLYLPKSESASPAIEYYDAEALREFLYKRPEIPHSSSPRSTQSTGVLQHFALPKGARNSTLRVIWSPKLCLLERRVNVHAIHDARFSVYERGVTFEEGGGAEALSRPEPVRGSILPGMVQELCERVVDHVTRVSYHKFRIARMVLRLQVDADDRLWLLWSSSLRLQPPLAPATTIVALDMPASEAGIRPLDIVSDAKVPAFAFAQGSGGGPVSLSSTSNPEVDEEPRSGQSRCASCAQVVALRALLPTTYKAVLAHFQHVLKFLRERVNEESQVAIEWPPNDRVVQQAGGIGFGILRHLKSVNSSSDDSGLPKTSLGLKSWQGRELLVPPVIRYLHPTLRAEDFARHRQDPIFLHKTVGVCERCCLVYADYATASLEVNALGIRSSASAPALLRPVREKPKHTDYFDDDPSDALLLTSTNLNSPITRGARTAYSKTKPPASAWKPVPTDDRQQGRLGTYKSGPHSTLHFLPMAPKLPPRIETFDPEDNDALRIPDGLHDGSPQQQQEREEAFFRELYQQKDTTKHGGHALRHILEAADRLSKAKPQHRLAALGDNTQIGQSQSTGALMGAITELKLAKKPDKSPYSVVQRIRGGEGGRGSSLKNQAVGSSSPAKTPLKQVSKSSKKKKNLEKSQDQSEGGTERKRFVSSREKRSAAAHRGYLVAALSDAQVQLEHIESLATLVISAPDIESDLEPKEKLHRRQKRTDQDNERSSRDVEAVEQMQELNEQFEAELDGQEHHALETNDSYFNKEEEHHEEGDPTPDEEDAVEREDRRSFDDGTLDDDHPLSHEVETPFEQCEQDIHEEADIQNQEHCEAMSTGTIQSHENDQFQGEETSLEHEQNDAQLELQDHTLEYIPDLEQVPTNDILDPGQTQNFESEYALNEMEHNQLQHQVQVQDDENQYECENEYEDHGQENEHSHDQEAQDLQQTLSIAREDSFTADEPSQYFLEQVQDLLATAASSDSDDFDTVNTSDERRAAQEHDISSGNGGSNAFVELEDDSSDDAVIAADSAVAVAVPLPLSEESNSAASDE